MEPAASSEPPPPHPFKLECGEELPSGGALCRDSFREAMAARCATGPPPRRGAQRRPLVIGPVRVVFSPTGPIPAPLKYVVIYGGRVVGFAQDLEYALVQGREWAYCENAACWDKEAKPVVIEPPDGSHLFAGLMDAHVHCTAVVADLTDLRNMPPTLLAARSAVVLGEMLRRGFTAVRDAGGADWGIASAVGDGSILGPRVLFSGRALSQTGGHGDFRAPGAERLESNCPCACAAVAGIGRVCDGVDAVRKAAREELRLGAHFIKAMCSGGVSSPTDSLEHDQFSEDELRALCAEAANRNSYVGAHAYKPRSIRRALECGVRSIEHGNYLDDATANEMARRGAFLVPTLVTYESIVRRGAAAGFPPALVAKARGVLLAGLRSLSVAGRAGVRICFGSDLLGAMHSDQSREFELRHDKGGMSALELFASATTECAALFQRRDCGSVKAGAVADLCLASADPRQDVRVMSEAERRVLLVLKDGLVAKAPTVEWGDAINAAMFDPSSPPACLDEEEE